MKSTLRILLIGSAAIASAGLASASLSYYDIAPVNFDSAVPTNYTTLSFAKFDTLGGTRVLTGVDLEWSITSVLSSVAIQNTGTVGSTVTINRVGSTASFTIDQGGDNFLDTTTANFSFPVSPPVTLVRTVVANPTLTVGPHTFTAVTSGGFVDITSIISNLANYSGAGTINFDLLNSFDIAPHISAGGGASVSFTTVATGSASGSLGIRYHFTPVPEPGSLLALGCLVGSGAFLRTRRRHA